MFTSLAAAPVVAGVMLAALNGGGATATSSNAPAAEKVQVTLQAGQSLWQLAEEIAPGADPRDVISDIVAVNNLNAVSVQAGQRITVPSAYTPE